MRIFWTLLRRELSAFFFSLTGYVIIAAVTLVIGSSFVMLIRNMGTDPFSKPVTELFFNSLMYGLLVILMAPVITMRVFALEQDAGTVEPLVTPPGGDLHVVSANFIAAARSFCPTQRTPPAKNAHDNLASSLTRHILRNLLCIAVRVVH